MERDNLLAALEAAGGKVGTSGAAALLGVNPNTLTSRLRALGFLEENVCDGPVIAAGASGKLKPRPRVRKAAN